MKKTAIILAMLFATITTFGQGKQPLDSLPERQSRTLVETQISNHPVFNDVQRFVTVSEYTMNLRSDAIGVTYKITYVLDSTDISDYIGNRGSGFGAKQSFSIRNSKKIYLKDSLGNRIPNENFTPIHPQVDYEEIEGRMVQVDAQDPINAEDEYVHVPAFDLFLFKLYGEEKAADIRQLLAEFIVLLDSEKYFD